MRPFSPVRAMWVALAVGAVLVAAQPGGPSAPRNAQTSHIEITSTGDAMDSEAATSSQDGMWQSLTDDTVPTKVPQKREGQLGRRPNTHVLQQKVTFGPTGPSQAPANPGTLPRVGQSLGAAGRHAGARAAPLQLAGRVRTPAVIGNPYSSADSNPASPRVADSAIVSPEDQSPPAAAPQGLNASMVEAHGLGAGHRPYFDSLESGWCIVARGGWACMAAPEQRFWLCAQPDGEVLLLDRDSPLGAYYPYWRSNTSNPARTAAIWLCVDDKQLSANEEDPALGPGYVRPAYWWVRWNTTSTPWRLYMQDDGQLAMYGRQCEQIWTASNSQQTERPVVTQCWPAASAEKTLTYETWYGRKQLILFKDPKTQAAAQAVCNARGGDLAAIRGYDEHEMLYQAFAGVDSRAWVGLVPKGSSFSAAKADWKWISMGNTSDYYPYDGWRSGSPSTSDPGQGSVCAGAWFSDGGGYFATLPCNEAYAFACEIAGCQGSISEKYFTADLPLVRYNTVLNTPCTSPYTGNVNLTCSVSGRFEYSPGCERRWVVGNKTLAFVVQGMTQPDARAACQQRGGELLTMQTTAERDAVISEQQGISGYTWFGLESLNRVPSTNRADYRWLSTGRAPTIDLWGADEPAGYSEGICVELRSDTNSWHSWSCDTTQPFTCQIGCSGARLPLLAYTGANWPADLCDGAAAGSACVSRCNTGFMPGTNGPPTVTCGASGTWSSVTGSCVTQTITCSGQPLAKANATWACANVPVNGVCTATCAPGTVGPVNATCLGNPTRWNTPVGNCKPITCAGSPTITSGTFSCGTSSAVNRTCIGTCSTGFAGTINATCSANGTWSVAGVCTRTCSGNPAAPANGAFACPVTLAGRNCTATCNAATGYTGAPYSVCQTTGTWGPLIGTCNRGCLGSPTATNATFACGTVTAVGGRCNATCAAGLVGDVFATCQATTFTWSVNSNTSPCRPACMGNPPQQPNTNFSCGNISAPGSTCRATCHRNFNGTVRTTCLANGQWDMPKGRCTPLVCTGNPPNPRNGVFDCSKVTPIGKVTAVGRSCTASCTESAGKPTAVCMSDGTWSRVVGSCQGGCLGNPCANLANSTGVCTDIGEEGRYSCGCVFRFFFDGEQCVRSDYG